MSNMDNVKILFMGKEISHEELPEPDAATIEDYFAPVYITGHAIDMASKVVPKEHWQIHGLHSWLTLRAQKAFEKMPASAKEIVQGRLKYVFTYTDKGPELKTVILQ